MTFQYSGDRLLRRAQVLLLGRQWLRRCRRRAGPDSSRRGRLGGTGRTGTAVGCRRRCSRPRAAAHGRRRPSPRTSSVACLSFGSSPESLQDPPLWTPSPEAVRLPVPYRADPEGLGANVTSTITRRRAIRETSGRLWISQPTHVAVVDISAMQRRLPRVHTDWGLGPPSGTRAQARSGTARVGADHFPSGTTAAIRSPLTSPARARSRPTPPVNETQTRDTRSWGAPSDVSGTERDTKAFTKGHDSPTPFNDVSGGSARAHRVSPTPPNHAGRVRDVLRHLTGRADTGPDQQHCRDAPGRGPTGSLPGASSRPCPGAEPSHHPHHIGW